MSSRFLRTAAIYLEDTAGTVLAGGAAWSAADFSAPTTKFDTFGGLAWNALNPTRFVAPWPGYYRVHARAKWTPDVNGNKNIALRTNGTIFTAVTSLYTNEPGYGFQFHTVSDFLLLAAGDYVELVAQGGPSSVFPTILGGGQGFAMVYVHPPIGAVAPVRNVLCEATYLGAAPTPPAAVWTPLVLNTTNVDTDGMRSGTSTQFVIKYSGYYELEGRLFSSFGHQPGNSQGGLGTAFAIDGDYTNVRWPCFSTSTTGGGDGQGSPTSGVEHLNAGQIVELVTFTNGAVSIFDDVAQGPGLGPHLAVRMLGQ